MTSDYCHVTVQRLFSKNFRITWNIEKSCFTVGQRSRDLRPVSRDRSATFFKIFPNGLKRPKKVVWQSADGRVTSDQCRVTVQWLFSKFFVIAWNVQKRCLTVGRRSRDLRPVSRDRSVTFFKSSSNCLIRRKTVVWQSADSRVTSDLVGTSKNVVWKSADCHVTVRLLCSRGFFFVRLHMRCLADVYLVLILILINSFRRTGQHSAYFDHVTPPSEEGQSWIFDIKWKIFLGRRDFLILVGKL